LRHLFFIVLGIAFTLASCASGAWAALRVATYEPTANPPFAETKLGAPYAATFVDARPRTLGVCVEATPGALYSVDVTTRGATAHYDCKASPACGFAETCSLGPIETGSTVVFTGPSPARCQLYEAQPDEGGRALLLSFGVAVFFVFCAVGSFLLAAVFARKHDAAAA